MRFLSLFVALLFCLPSARSQSEDRGMYFVGFADKQGTPLTVNDADRLLSERALARREKTGMKLTQDDLPVSPAYEAAVRAAGGTVWLRSRWMNGLVVSATPAQRDRIAKLSSVDTLYYVAPYQYDRTSAVPVLPNFDRPAPRFDRDTVSETFYGAGYKDLRRMGGDSLHRMGYRGAGMLVAVFDGGFPQVNYPGFLGYPNADVLPANYDVVQQDETAFDGGSHGATVLSTMAAHHPFFIIGTAPEARYICFTTENGQGEHRLEEINYAIALEIADSIGVDVVNSSLGYTTFTDKTMNYRYEDMNGNRSPASLAIDKAFARGMIVVTSAGNEGGDAWKYISVPADSKSVLAVGALHQEREERASFSSFGPTFDGRVKPDVMAPGSRVAAVNGAGRGISYHSGTSLSAPLVTGLVACLWQAFPDKTNAQIVDALRQTSSRYATPDGEYGYGIVNFAAAYRLLKGDL
ncbi:MAG: S8 family serine peptidase [Saprospiraceae bacterium]